MANLNIKFNNKSYSIDPTSLADATTRLEAHLASMAGGGDVDSNVITWDGNTEGLPSIDIYPDLAPGMAMMYKVSDLVFTTDELIGATVITSTPDGDIEEIIGAEHIVSDENAGVIQVTLANGSLITAHKAPNFAPEVGTYFAYINMGDNFLLVKELRLNTPDTPEDTGVITWDGNTEGRKIVDLGEGMIAVKLADFVSKEQIMGATITTSIGETFAVGETPWNDTNTMFTDELSWNNSFVMLFGVHSAETTDGFIPGVYASFEPGLYTLYVAEANMYVSEIILASDK